MAAMSPISKGAVCALVLLAVPAAAHAIIQCNGGARKPAKGQLIGKPGANRAQGLTKSRAAVSGKPGASRKRAPKKVKPGAQHKAPAQR